MEFEEQPIHQVITEIKGGKHGHHNIDFCYHRRIYRVKLVYATGRLFGGRG